MTATKATSILTGDEKLDKHFNVGPDPHGAMCTGTGHSKAGVKHDHAVANQQMKLTKEEQDIMDGKKGEVLAKVMKTVVTVGNIFGADKLVDLGGNPHTVLMFGSAPVVPILDIFKECTDAGLKAYAPYTIDPRPYDFYNVEITPEYNQKVHEAYDKQQELEAAHLLLGAKDMNYWSCAYY